MAVTYNLGVYRGDTAYWQFVFWDDRQKTQPTDLTGVTPLCQIRPQIDGSVIATIQCAVGLPNIINCSLEATITDTLPAHAVWDLQLTYPSGDVLTPICGNVTTAPDVSDASKP